MHTSRIEFITNEQRWSGLLRRDPQADGRYLYAVRTTGVYCRPTCSSRRPNRENVVFFEDSDGASRAGYRPCRKCRPDGTAAAIPDEVLHACCIIDAAQNPPQLAELAEAVGLNSHALQRLFKKSLGVTPKAYALAQRAEKFRQGLNSETTISGAVVSAGFGSTSRCYESIAPRLGMTPSEFKSGGTGQQIRYATSECSLGHVLVAATARGLCAIELGDDTSLLETRLRDRFPQAQFVEDDIEFSAWLNAVVNHLEAPRTRLQVPLDICATAFQERVWRALQSIPPGSTLTYSELARRIGNLSAVRAVAGACSSNPLAVAIPCHRVVGSDGSLTGYRWGLERKRALLDREAQES